MRLLNDKIAVRPDKAPDQTASGIVLPDAAKAKPVTGEVVEAGPEALPIPPGENGEPEIAGVQKGNKVIFSEYAGIAVEIDDEELVILRESDILVIL